MNGTRAAAVLACAVWLSACPVQAQPAEPARNNLLSLSASASAEVTLDTLAITLAVVREGAEAAEVQSQLAAVVEAALAAARPGVRAGQVEVRSGPFSVGPRQTPRGTIAGWQGRAEIVVEGRDVAGVSRMAGRLPGVTVARVNFSLSREARERVEAEVSAQAIARFRERAQHHAQAFGFASYTVREVQVGSPEVPMFAPMPMLRMAAGAPRPAEESVPVEPGRATVTSTVNGSVVMMR